MDCAACDGLLIFSQRDPSSPVLGHRIRISNRAPLAQFILRNRHSMPVYRYPNSSAFNTARVRSRTPSLARMLDAWFFTVPSTVPSASEISRLL
jgi:hypothetical protein